MPSLLKLGERQDEYGMGEDDAFPRDLTAGSSDDDASRK
jgi:hypothetical protein